MSRYPGPPGDGCLGKAGEQKQGVCPCTGMQTDLGTGATGHRAPCGAEQLWGGNEEQVLLHPCLGLTTVGEPGSTAGGEEAERVGIQDSQSLKGKGSKWRDSQTLGTCGRGEWRKREP